MVVPVRSLVVMAVAAKMVTIASMETASRRSVSPQLAVITYSMAMRLTWTAVVQLASRVRIISHAFCPQTV